MEAARADTCERFEALPDGALSRLGPFPTEAVIWGGSSFRGNAEPLYPFVFDAFRMVATAKSPSLGVRHFPGTAQSGLGQHRSSSAEEFDGMVRVPVDPS
ncbi:hypothetical protein [Mesorhizobium sp. WSM4906]|uniref:hypothetical protein n=1 Tax=Mesorhizobium sp. WSM4906 TaxID=3038546 RepID=UPI0024175D83|nr:hypothetical protein [Mesorhizobium sp. WSM4906]WFP77932.1 hypothetical protein QAZ22_09140 [Mesorhizobium sp. WSM4906]